jgi:hypothetical protein
VIPKIIHFVFGLQEDFGGKPFSFIHFLAVFTAWKVNRPDRMLFHYAIEPKGEWWRKAKPYLTLNKIDTPTQIFGNTVTHYAHRADIVRLEMLKTYGGIYLDLDVLCINSFDPLLRQDFVMGIQQNSGLCNAVILSKANAPFLAMWLEEYKSFDDKIWCFHSVNLPYHLARSNSSLCYVLNKDMFFYPIHNDPVHRYLFGLSVPLTVRIRSVAESFGKLGLHLVRLRKLKPGGFTLHALRSKEWHYRKLRNAYCVHLWESQWWNQYLVSLTPDFINTDKCNLGRVLRDILGDHDVSWMSADMFGHTAVLSSKLAPEVEINRQGSGRLHL